MDSKSGIKDDSDEDNDNLMSMEELRYSPELWSNQISGLNEYISKNLTETPQPAWTRGLTPADLTEIQRFGAMSTTSIINELRKIYDQAYQLGIQEAKEMTRGRYLNVFVPTNNAASSRNSSFSRK